jgi:hypothetical protein
MRLSAVSSGLRSDLPAGMARSSSLGYFF